MIVWPAFALIWHSRVVLRSVRESLTLLHLSDPQFGPNQPEAEGLTAADRQHDTLQVRLLQDLEEITSQDGVPRPELVVVTGDLTEHAKPTQFAAFEAFANALMGQLELPRDRLVLVPGNHDVSWSGCKAYFHQCAAEERKPEPPHWPKWKAYVELLERWYGEDSPVVITKERPWSLFVFEELCTVVAGLNSTMAETHEDGQHYGHVGEAQVEWYRRELAPHRRNGWLRIAAVHHNVQRNATKDDSNLQDASLIEWRLSEQINLVLHGHTHDGKLGFLRPEIPVVSTGSTAVIGNARPHGVPCQYQVVSVQRGELRRWTRAYFEARDRKGFGADVSPSRRRNDWRHVDPVPFAELGAFSAPAPVVQDRTQPTSGPTKVAATPLFTAIVLDRTEAWEKLTTTMVEAEGSAVFVVWGTWHQDIQLFMRRIESYFNEQALARHKILTVDPTHDGSRATAAEDWTRATIAATDSRLSPLSAALVDEAFRQPLLLLLSDGGPICAATRKEQDAVVDFVVQQLPAVLEPSPPGKPPRSPVRVVVPIELPEDGSTELVKRILRGVVDTNLELFDHELTLPKWPDIEKSLGFHAKWLGVTLSHAQLDRCEAHYKEVIKDLEASGEARMLFLGNRLHDLVTELLREAKLSHTLA